MKKCPYCAELIQDEAIVCRFCNRDLVENVEQVITKRKIELGSTPSDLSLNDLVSLFKKWGESYGTFPPHMREECDSVARTMLLDVVSPIFAIYLEKDIFDDAEYQKISMAVVAKANLWSFLCFAIGLESGVGRLAEEDVPYCLHPVSKPYRDYLADWVIGLLKAGKINAKKANSFVEDINDNLTKYSVKLGNLGIFEGKGMKEQESKPYFYESLLAFRTSKD